MRNFYKAPNYFITIATSNSNFKKRKLPQAILTAALISWLSTSTTSFAEIPHSLEATYSEAVLLYNERDYNNALQILNELNKSEPNTVEFLELKALILEATKKEKDSYETYAELIKLKNSQGAPPEETAPYHFELGILRYQHEQESLAKRHFEEALKGNFNPETSHFFLGQIAFKEKNFQEAKNHFIAVADADIDDLLSPAYFYLGQIYLSIDLSANSAQSFISARNHARKRLESKTLTKESQKIATQIMVAADKALEPFDQSGTFGTIGFQAAYDSNVLAIGNGIAGVTAGSTTALGAGTPKGTLSFNVGYSSSPLDTIQFVPGYRATMNLNSNESTLQGEYITQNVSLYMTKNAVSPWSYGLKVEGGFIFQNQGSTASARNFSPFNATLAFGPYTRLVVGPMLALSAELYATPQRFYIDTSIPSNQARSGTDYQFRVSLKNDRGNKYWNPGGWVLASYNNTTGTEFRSIGGTLEFNNTMRLTPKLTILEAFDLGYASYDRSPNPTRTDIILTLSIRPSYRLSQKFSITGELQFTRDMVRSSDTTAIDQYAYDRFVSGAGILYVF